MRFSSEFRHALITLAASTIAGALAGFVAGWTAASWPVDVSTFFATSTGIPQSFKIATSTRLASEVTVIPVDRKPAEPIVPAPFVERRISSIAMVYRRTQRKIGDDALLTDDRMIGQAVAVTSDGWFVLPKAELDGLHPSDLILWHHGKTAGAVRAVLDRLSGVVFIKTDFNDLPVSALARLHEVSLGLPVWIERRPRYFEPRNVAALAEPIRSLDGGPSESVDRRLVIGGLTAQGDIGAAVWSLNGGLIGQIASGPNEPITLIPTTAWASSLRSILSDNAVRHAFLGVRTVELSTIRLEQASELPNRGAWLRDDKRGKKPAVERNSPAAKAGLRAGDVIQKIDRDILDGSSDLSEMLAEYKPGSTVTLTVLRGKETLEIPVALGSVVTSEEIK